MLAKCALISLVLTGSLLAESIDYTDAGEHVGETLTVTGRVNRVSTIPSGMTFVTFGGSGATEFTVVFRANVVDGKNLEGFEGRDAEATGTIELYKDKPQILAKSPDDLRLAGGAEMPDTPARAKSTFEVIDVPLTDEETKAAGTAPSGMDVTGIRLATNTPDGLDPEKPQRVLLIFPDYISGDNIERPLSGFTDTAAAEGWLAVAPISPTIERDLSPEWHSVVTLAALKHLGEKYPAIKTWPLYLAGNGDGATFAMLASGSLVENGYNVAGCFLGSVWKPRFEESKEAFRPSKRLMRRIPIFVSHGKDNGSVSTERCEENVEAIESAGFRKTRVDFFEGDRDLNPESLAKALKWFEEQDQK